jgi:murein DD-endopeptidase MepM/ murein hydrolase activator NlpD
MLTIRKFIGRQALMKYHQKPFRIYFQGSILSSLFCTGLLVIFCITTANADIYRFVTIDGVETFTDAPLNKEAKVVRKDRISASSKRLKSSKKQITHDISLDEIVGKTVTAALNPQESSHEFFQPQLPSVGGIITSKVGMRTDPIDGTWRLHNGIDISIPTGTPVKPVSSGVVIYCGSRSGYGNTVIVEHDNGIVTLYAHNNRLMVTQGQLVTSDTILALSGSTGRSTGPHLHFEAWQSGKNITMAFLPDSDMKIPKATLIAKNHRTSNFRSETLSDGSILFTNLPATTP